jgi:plasmid stabilization system protein ParE
MIVELHPRARLEYDDAIAWYAVRDVDVAFAFDDAVGAAIRRIASLPSLGPPHPRIPSIRQLRLARFPFILPYRIRAESSLILAIAHTSRLQDYWSRRSGPR